MVKKLDKATNQQEGESACCWLHAGFLPDLPFELKIGVICTSETSADFH
jgi:hypothetical protein